MAATITGTITVDINAGKFAGIYNGDFSYDDTHLTKVGTEFMTINSGNGTISGLLSFNFTFLDFATGLKPVTYTARDVDSFPDYPLLVFENGHPTEFGLQIFSASGNDALGFLNPTEFRYALQNGTYGGDGLVTLGINESTPEIEPPAVPENVSPITSFLTILGFGAFRWLKKPRKVND